MYQKKAEYLIAYNKVLRKRIGLLKVEKDAAAHARDEFERALETMKMQNAGLQKEVEVLRKNFDVALQTRMRLAQVEEASRRFEFIQKGKENILHMQMAALIREVEDINQYLREIRDNRIAPRIAIPGAKTSQQQPALQHTAMIDGVSQIKYIEQINDLKARINILTEDNAVLREKLRIAQDMANKNKLAMDSGAQKIAELQSRLIEAESSTAQSQRRCQELERDVASLRQRYVANELEKEQLNIKLNRLNAELNDVRSKFLTLLGKITDIFSSSGKESASGQRYNLTSVIGVELFPDTTDTEK